MLLVVRTLLRQQFLKGNFRLLTLLEPDRLEDVVAKLDEIGVSFHFPL